MKEIWTDADVDATEGASLLGAETLLADTLGLMTAHAETRCDAERRRLARKVAAGLSRLADEPGVSAHFRLILYTMTAHWRKLEHEYTEVPPHPDSIYTRSVSNSVH